MEQSHSRDSAGDRGGYGGEKAPDATTPTDSSVNGNTLNSNFAPRWAKATAVLAASATGLAALNFALSPASTGLNSQQSGHDSAADGLPEDPFRELKTTNSATGDTPTALSVEPSDITPADPEVTSDLLPPRTTIASTPLAGASVLDRDKINQPFDAPLGWRLVVAPHLPEHDLNPFDNRLIRLVQDPTLTADQFQWIRPEDQTNEVHLVISDQNPGTDLRIVAHLKSGERVPLRVRFRDPQGIGFTTLDLRERENAGPMQLAFVTVEGLPEAGRRRVADEAFERAAELGVPVLPFAHESVVGTTYDFALPRITRDNDGILRVDNTELVQALDFQGKVVVLEMYATWCGACRLTYPQLVDLQSNNPDDLAVVMVNYDNRDDPRTNNLLSKLISEFKMDELIHTAAPVAQGEMGERWSQSLTGNDRHGIPFTIIIDRTGKLAFAGHPGLGDKISHIVNDILKQDRPE